MALLSPRPPAAKQVLFGGDDMVKPKPVMQPRSVHIVAVRAIALVLAVDWWSLTARVLAY